MERLQKLTGTIRTILECVNKDLERYIKTILYFTKGYEEDVLNLVNRALFHEGHNKLVIMKDIDAFSLYEHHIVPFTSHVRTDLYAQFYGLTLII
jgi:GTP cyclohydrolase I